MNIKKIFYAILGCLSLALGTVGTILPILPTVPFLMLAAFCFVRSSEKLHLWFCGTKLYKNNLESFVQGKGMTRKTKLRIIGTVTILMAFGFLMMKRTPIGRLILFCVWLFHLIYFIWGIKTLEETDVS